MNRTQSAFEQLQTSQGASDLALTKHGSKDLTVRQPSSVDVNTIVEAAQVRVEQTLDQIAVIVDRAGAEAELINDVVFQRSPDGTELLTIKRQVRLQKDPH